jgi:hypothetical protein
MNRTMLAIALTSLLALIGCGSSSNNTTNTGNNATGNWSLTLDGTNGQPVMTFIMGMTQSSNMGLTGNNFNITMGSSCFGPGSTMSGQLAMGGMNGMSTMTMTMASGPGPGAQNVLQMQANMPAGMASGTGTWTLTGNTPGCNSDSGTFTMTRLLPA